MVAHFFSFRSIIFHLQKKKICAKCLPSAGICFHSGAYTFLQLKDNAHWSCLSLHYKEHTGLPLPPNYQGQTARWRTTCMCMWGWGGLNYTVLLHRNMELRNTTVGICQPWKISTSGLSCLKRTGIFLTFGILHYIYLLTAHQGQNTTKMGYYTATLHFKYKRCLVKT